VEEVVTRTLESTPPNATHWSTRSMAAATKLSRATVHRIWQAFGLQPHRTETFKLSADPYLVEKVRDIVGLYLNPPDHAVVLCVDEKSQAQALDRTRPILPLRPGLAERQTHDYIRHGTTSLFAALDIRTGEVIGTCHRRHRHQEFLKFLELVDSRLGDQLQDAQSETLVSTTSPLPSAFHSDQWQLDQSGRAVLCADHGQAHPSWKLRKRSLLGASHS
jgi:hypothetical protein